MDPIALLMATFFVLIFLRVEISFALAASSLLVIWVEDLPLISALNQMYTGIDSFPLLAVPFFMFLGRLLNDSGITDRLLRVADASVGHIRGGLGHVNVFVSMIFASLSGSAAADTASIGAILIPAMKKAGYDPGFSVALTAASSTLGVIIPPSIILVIYGAFGNVSIGALFWGGFVPGILIGLAMMAYTYVMALKYGYPANPRATFREWRHAVRRGLLPLAIPVLILGGVTGGVFTPTEAAIIAVGWAMLLAFAIYRTIAIASLPRMLGEAVVDFAIPLFTVAAASIFGWLISYLGAADLVVNAITSITDDPFGLMLLLVIFLLIIGTFLNPISAVLIFLPIIQQLGDEAGTDPVQLGVITIMTLAIGLVTPPYGVCLLIAAQIGQISVQRALVAVLPICALTVGIIVLSILVPDIILGLPKLMMPQIFAMPGGGG
ncbi:TRAP transporter large permease [Propylenella binzhouense]|uniref:TRAP transporter large permease protein n=1 Tax=Propylenella binzhouense TaxID=2555902 RepID=A0A964WTS6_9HYPH|nr:TRAP transporter large permease [Propylenella binzhouense]MYZ48303.1 TRAP transporter large permease [Propylenella binzhouense]